MRFQRIDEKIDTVLGALPDKPVMDNLDGPVVEGNNIQVKWDVSQPADSVSITISTSKSGTYYSTTISSINDDGNYTITAANLNSILNNAPSGIYTLNVEVIRKKFYPVNPIDNGRKEFCRLRNIFSCITNQVLVPSTFDRYKTGSLLDFRSS